ncbi:DNA cytosine methyltransferase [Akkermansia muciniphila]|nr:DNA cytosine methyltransferase [Candidatus Akkermansia timonensis]MBT9561410.1 DNA cytosine methyltransferase [Candidatus Akkermansia timonensis]MBT9599671.1 DNA cytosine methyltransferase [Akkermansia muciniphila]
MKYLSVCSGIEAASVAWASLGWDPVAFSEIEPFPSAVLAERFPDVPNLGDMTKYHEWNIPAIDLMVGGTPCQAFSVAGKRGSLADDRGNLCLTFCRMADHFSPKWVLWENVPGVLSTPDNAFGCFLGALCGADAPVIPPGGGRKHPNSGVVSGPKRTVAWRVLDAQWHRVPQRRKRVFVLAVAGAGNWASADALLPVGERVPGNLEACRQAWKEAAGNAGSRFEGSHWDGGRVHPTLYAHKSGVGMSDQEIFRQRGAPTLDASYGDKWTGDQYCFRDGFFVYENHAQDSRVREMGDVCSTVSAKYGTGGGNTPIVVFTQNDAGRDAAVDVAPTLRSGHGGGAVNQCVCLPVDIRNAIRQSDNDVTGKGWGDVGDPMYTLTAGGKIPDVCYGLYENQRAEMRLYDGVQPTVSCGGGKAGQGNNMILVCNPVYHFVVRRLTPRECERLQGFPDDWTLIPWRGKPAEDCPDSHRYKAVGNSMAVPVMWYIGRRIQIVERRMAA